MNPIQLMELHKERFTQNDCTIYQAIMENPERIISKTTSQLAADCGVSQPALSRFVKGLGYSRYRDFRSDFVAWLASESQANKNRSDTKRQPYFTTLSNSIAQVEELLTDSYMRSLASYINAHARIYASGTSKSFQPAQLFEILMRRNRRGVHAVSHDSIDELVDYMDADDLLVLFSVSAREDNVRQAVQGDHDVLLITANPNHSFKDRVSKTVAIPYVGIDAEAASVSPILFDIFVEILTQYLVSVDQPETQDAHQR